VYLRGRSPIAINSNYYVLDSGDWQPTTCQEARAAAVIYSMLLYKERLTDETLEPTMVGDGTVPLCMWQFERMFSTSRIPGRECDEIKHWDPTYSQHIVVNCKGTHYKVTAYRRDGTLRGPDEFEQIFADIKADAAKRQPREAEKLIPALTGENRTKWAEVRETYLLEGHNNRCSLHDIESALFYVSLADETFDTADWTGRGKYLIGSSNKRPDVWFDKSINLVVFSDGKTGLNCEHAWADAPVCAHMFEVSMIVGEEKLTPYDEKGACNLYCVVYLPPPANFM
jgi:carnitine O-palmitoyltransferase 1